ncbi:hypothetical protein BCR42DRAFT_419134 [Absidia repens]|uniref:Uncharacterized protein n=1 Tax=Absidia repens TaxID=90262 RepID=A0A1X2IAX4_9FUNG|nr:hypothetical protein BCR42DRAFT_419134 [Absidia repens]
MARLIRLTYYLVALLFFLILSIVALSRYQLVNTVPTPSTKVTKTPIQFDTKYLSWLPHGEFTDQHEAFRNAVQLGKELNRTVIAPMLRLGKPLAWQPFEQMAQTYSTLQNKQLIRQKCTELAVVTNDQTCITLNDWTEIPWSSLFDLDAISTEFGIPIIERTHGHGWGLDETSENVMGSITDTVVIDVLTFMENSTFYSQHQQRQWDGLFGRQSSQRILNQPTQDKNKLPLKTVIRPQQWKDVDQRQYIQFGALSSTPRYQLHSTPQQQALRKALSRHLFVSPNQMAPLKYQADQVIATLGGVNHFSSLRLNLAKVIALDARVNKDATGAPITTMDDLDVQTQKELMDAVVLEVFGDIPINQAVSAAMPVNPDSTLARILLQQQPSSSPQERRQLLDACIDYRQNIEERYPIYYLVNDHIPSPASQPDTYGPLLSFFPCLFTKSDMKHWGKLDMSTWISSSPVLQDIGVDYEKMLDPMLDILISGQGINITIMNVSLFA